MDRRSFSYAFGALALSVSACAAPGSDDDFAVAATDSDDTPLAQAATSPVPVERAVRLSAGSGVYLGGNRFLTNWHVCTDSMSLVIHNDPGGGAPPFREGAPCNARRASCNPPATVTFEGAPRLSGQAVFFSRLIDTCIVELPAGATLPVRDQPLEIELTPLKAGHEVVVASYPGGARTRVVERCKVTKEVTRIRDPDKVNPSTLDVPSLELDCETVQHGSSGAPVFDAATGKLIGLIWTGVCLPSDGRNCRGPIYVTAASAWAGEHKARPVAQHSRLDALLDDQGVP